MTSILASRRRQFGYQREVVGWPYAEVLLGINKKGFPAKSGVCYDIVNRRRIGGPGEPVKRPRRVFHAATQGQFFIRAQFCNLASVGRCIEISGQDDGWKRRVPGTSVRPVPWLFCFFDTFRIRRLMSPVPSKRA